MNSQDFLQALQLVFSMAILFAMAWMVYLAPSLRQTLDGLASLLRERARLVSYEANIKYLSTSPSQTPYPAEGLGQPEPDVDPMPQWAHDLANRESEPWARDDARVALQQLRSEAESWEHVRRTIEAGGTSLTDPERVAAEAWREVVTLDPVDPTTEKR